MLAQSLLTIFNKFRKAAPFRQSQFSCPVLGSIQSPSVVNLLEFPACVNRQRLYFPYLCQFTWLEFPLQSSLVKLQSFTNAPIVSIYRDLCVLIYDILLGFYNSPRVSIYRMVWCLALVSLQRFSGVLILSIARCFIIKIK